MFSAGQNPPDPSAAQPAGPRPIGLRDIFTWRSISGQAVSDDGRWFACRIVPQQGDGEVLFKRTDGSKEYAFPAGEGRMGTVALSADGTYGAFIVNPGSEEARRLRRERKPMTLKAVIVNLASGEKVEYDKVRSFRFSEDNPAWIVLHKSAPESQAREKDKWAGSDLILHELATGKDLVLGNVAEFAFDKKGSRLALVIDAYGQSGNGILLRDMAAGAIVTLDSDKASYQRLAWNEAGTALTCLKGKDDKDYEDKLYAVVGFSEFAQAGPKKTMYDPKDDKKFPEGMTISPNRTPRWTETGEAILFGIHVPKKKSAEGRPAAGPGPEAAGPGGGAAADEDMPDLVLWHGADKRLQSEQQVQSGRDRNFSYLAEYRVKDKRFIRLADDEVRDVVPAPKDLYAIGRDNRAYELEGNLDGRDYTDVYVINLADGSRTPALKKNRWLTLPSPDGTRFLHYDDGAYFVHDMASGKSISITKDVPADFVNEDDDHNVKNPPDYPVGWTVDGQTVLLSDGWDIWAVSAKGGPGVNLTVNGRKDGIRYQRRLQVDREEKGIDLSKPMYVSTYGEWTKKAGISLIEKGRPGPKVLLWEDAGFGALLKARKAETYLYTRETFRDYPDWRAAGPSLSGAVRLTVANPQQKDFLWSSGQILIDYKIDPASGKTNRLQGALFLPAGYEKGKAYPTIVYYYEKTSQSFNRYIAPSANGFNKSVYTSNGYAVFYPDIAYKINDPGMSAAWCVLPALDAAAATGVVDRSKVGLQGHSWGGYQTAFLVTQADFAAAVAGAPLTNMISMYSSIYFNTGGANMAIFESSQGRFLGGYWDNLEAYQRNSPVYHAAKVKTPLIILHNDKDGAVDWNQGIEYYNTLRRMKKPVIMLQYVGENHGLSKAANQRDYTVRMKEWFDHWLKGAPAPAWMTEGVSHLDLKDHLKERSKLWKPEEKKPEEKKPPEKK
ncbi:MAG: prolyl oligopeptidase family serine peptidase [Candidatus Aminicenantes bacterium]|nr:prolyl oligopeptidase family serine peptidase [Candidatus Aminicenantes bacterium]